MDYRLLSNNNNNNYPTHHREYPIISSFPSHSVTISGTHTAIHRIVGRRSLLRKTNTNLGLR